MTRVRVIGCPRHAVVTQAWTMLHGLRVMGALPVALSDVYIARAYRSILEDTEGVVLPIWSLIETRCDITPTEVRLQIMATTLNQDEAEKIQATVGDPALRITLHDLTDRSEIYEVATNLCPADRFTYSNTLRIE